MNAPVYLEIFKHSDELQTVCGNIIWGQWVFWVPQSAARHLHNLCNCYQEFDTVLNFDMCTTLIDVSVLACGLLCASVQNERVLSSPVCVWVHVRDWVTLCAVRFGLWLFGGQCWCGLCLREWIYHLQPYRELHPLSWLFHSQRKKFPSPFYLYCLPITFYNF